MSHQDERDHLVDKLLRIKIGFKDIVFLMLIAFVSIPLAGVMLGIVNTIVSPYSTRTQIVPWLRDSDYVEEYERNDSENDLFRLDVKMATHGSDITVRMIRRGGPIQIISSEEFEPDKLALILDDDFARRNLQTQIEAVSARVPGWSSFVDDDGEACPIEEMRGIGFEYRIYPDKLSQHEFMNSLLDIDRAIHYSKERVDSLAQDKDDQT